MTVPEKINNTGRAIVNMINRSLNNISKIWAEGTDEEVRELGGVHSSKGWSEVWDGRLSIEQSYFKNVAALKAAEGLEAGQVFNTKGYYEPNDGGESTYLIRLKQSGDVDDGGSILTLADNTLVAELMIRNGIINIKQFGAKLDGVTDDSTVFNNVNTYLVSKKTTYNPNVLPINTQSSLFVPSGIMKINHTINIDIGVYGVRFDGTHIDATGLQDTVAIQLLGSNYPPYGSCKRYIEGFSLCGNATTSAPANGTIGLQISKSTTTTDYCAHLNIRNICIYGFETGIELKSHAYLIAFDNIELHMNRVCLYYPSGNIDSGENVQITNSCIYNSSVGIKLEANCEIFCEQTSFDYLGQAVLSATNTNIPLYFSHCHFEWNNTTKYYIEIGAHTQVTISDCGFYFGAPAASTLSVNAIIKVNDYTGYVAGSSPYIQFPLITNTLVANTKALPYFVSGSPAVVQNMTCANHGGSVGGASDYDVPEVCYNFTSSVSDAVTQDNSGLIITAPSNGSYIAANILFKIDKIAVHKAFITTTWKVPATNLKSVTYGAKVKIIDLSTKTVLKTIFNQGGFDLSTPINTKVGTSETTYVHTETHYLADAPTYVDKYGGQVFACVELYTNNWDQGDSLTLLNAQCTFL